MTVEWLVLNQGETSTVENTDACIPDRGVVARRPNYEVPALCRGCHAEQRDSR